MVVVSAGVLRYTRKVRVLYRFKQLRVPNHIKPALSCAMEITELCDKPSSTDKWVKLRVVGCCAAQKIPAHKAQHKMSADGQCKSSNV